jgi:hypothetical protein
VKKPRIQAHWVKLTQEQKDALERWLTVETLTYSKAVERLQKEFGVKFSIKSASSFFKAYCTPRMLNKAQALRNTSSKPLLEIVIERISPNGVSVKIFNPE